MPTTNVADSPANLEQPRKLWTRREYDALSSLVFDGQRLELIEGELVNKMGKKPPHWNSVALLGDWLSSIFGSLRVLREVPIDVAPEDNPTSEPEPDLSVLKRDRSHFSKSSPQPADLHLVIEVADSTPGFDIRTKARLYARAGIVEYWVADVTGRRMIVHREPQAGFYTSVVAYAADQRVAPLAAPDSCLRVGDAFLD